MRAYQCFESIRKLAKDSQADDALVLARTLVNIATAAVERLPDIQNVKDDRGLHGRPGENLGKHLLAMVGRGKLSWTDNDGLLRRFFENAPADDATHAVASVGVSLNNESDDILRRF